MGVPKIDGLQMFTMESPIEMDDLGVSPFMEPPLFQETTSWRCPKPSKAIQVNSKSLFLQSQIRSGSVSGSRRIHSTCSCWCLPEFGSLDDGEVTGRLADNSKSSLGTV